MMWVKYMVQGSGIRTVEMYDTLPASSTEAAKKIILARTPGATRVSILRLSIQNNPPSWWPGEKEKKEARRQEEMRRECEKEEHKRSVREEEKRRRDAERNAMRAEALHKSEHDELRREMEKLRKENSELKRDSLRSSGEFWGEGKYENFTDMARDQKDGMYKNIMDSETNILTAPLKLICWFFKEIFNPNSFLSQHLLFVVNVLLMLVGVFAYSFAITLLSVGCAVFVVVNCVIGLKTERPRIALIVAFIETVLFALLFSVSFPQISSQMNFEGKNLDESDDVIVRPPTSTMTDSRDGRIYKTVKIGEQNWLAENLNVKTDNSWCSENKEVNCEKYGRLYTWMAAKEACPVGWHLPSESEIKNLIAMVGGRGKAGKRLKAMAGWEKGENGIDAFSFAALPAGIKYDNGFYNYKDERAFFWSSSEGDQNIAYNMFLDYHRDDVGLDFGYKHYGLSVRCVED